MSVLCLPRAPHALTHQAMLCALVFYTHASVSRRYGRVPQICTCQVVGGEPGDDGSLTSQQCPFKTTGAASGRMQPSPRSLCPLLGVTAASGPRPLDPPGSVCPLHPQPGAQPGVVKGTAQNPHVLQAWLTSLRAASCSAASRQGTRSLLP